MDIGRRPNGSAVGMDELIGHKFPPNLNAILVPPEPRQQLDVWVSDALLIRVRQVADANRLPGGLQFYDQWPLELRPGRGCKLLLDLAFCNAQPLRESHVAHHLGIGPQGQEQVNVFHGCGSDKESLCLENLVTLWRHISLSSATRMLWCACLGRIRHTAENVPLWLGCSTTHYGKRPFTASKNSVSNRSRSAVIATRIANPRSLSTVWPLSAPSSSTTIKALS